MTACFGTDGIRGIVNEDLTAELAMQVGKATAQVLSGHLSHRPHVLVGMDTRRSGDQLGGAIMAGLTTMGLDVSLLGVLPTPAIAYLVQKYEADAGIMISASHNPAEFNGIKIFGGNGFKIPDAYEREIESLLEMDLPPLVKGDQVGRIQTRSDSVQDYVDFVVSTCDAPLTGIRALIDCANGSASATAAAIFHQLGLSCDIICAEPDGVNINFNCGSLHTEQLGRMVVAGGYDVGIAFDGDADRVQVVDAKGQLVDGDQLLAIFSAEMKSTGSLKKDALVGTVMSNLGLIQYAKRENLSFVATKVGDRFVLEEMEKNEYNLGGEQSGHIILRDLHTTGDGQLAAVRLLSIMVRTGSSAEKLAAVMERFPQVLENISANPLQKKALSTDPVIKKTTAEWEERLGMDGRILIRPSGTEPLVRVMVEGKDRDEILECVTELCRVIKERL